MKSKIYSLSSMIFSRICIACSKYWLRYCRICSRAYWYMPIIFYWSSNILPAWLCCWAAQSDYVDICWFESGADDGGAKFG